MIGDNIFEDFTIAIIILKIIAVPDAILLNPKSG